MCFHIARCENGYRLVTFSSGDCLLFILTQLYCTDKEKYVPFMELMPLLKILIAIISDGEIFNWITENFAVLMMTEI